MLKEFYSANDIPTGHEAVYKYCLEHSAEIINSYIEKVGVNLGMNTREWLYRAYNIDKEIKEIEEAYNSAVADVLYTSPQFDIDSVQKSPSNAAEQKVERLVMKKQQYLQRLQDLKDNKYKLLLEISRAIEQIPEPTTRGIMLRRYVNFKNIDEIAAQYFFSERNIYKILKNGELYIEFHPLHDL